MCLATFKNTKIETAGKNITVYKTVITGSRKIYYALYQKFTYKVGQLYKETSNNVLKPNLKGDCFDSISLGHYGNLNPDVEYYSEGFHSASSKARLVESFKYELVHKTVVIIKCIIPKGSRYIKDETGLIVSDQIQVVGRTITKLEQY